MKLTYFTRAVSNMAGFFSQYLVEKAQEAIRILLSIPLPTPSSAGPTTSSGETKSCVCAYTVNACRMYLVTCIQRQKHESLDDLWCFSLVLLNSRVRVDHSMIRI